MHADAAQACRTPPAGSPWPRSAAKKPKAVMDITPRTERAKAIAKSREALFSCLPRDLPESDYELSLTDLVEGDGSSDVPCGPAAPVKSNAETKQRGETMKGREKKRLRRSSSSSGQGILLNVYVPMTLAQSPSAGRRSRGSDRGREKMGMDHLYGRDLEPSFGGCWAVLWKKKKKEGHLDGL